MSVPLYHWNLSWKCSVSFLTPLPHFYLCWVYLHLSKMQQTLCQQELNNRISTQAERWKEWGSRTATAPANPAGVLSRCAKLHVALVLTATGGELDEIQKKPFSVGSSTCTDAALPLGLRRAQLMHATEQGRGRSLPVQKGPSFVQAPLQLRFAHEATARKQLAFPPCSSLNVNSTNVSLELHCEYWTCT